MFGLFRQKISPAEQSRVLIKNAQIHTHYIEGNIAAFMVFVDMDSSALEKHLNQKGAVAALLHAVELRIRVNKNFTDPYFFEVENSKEYSWKLNLLAKRIVVSREKKPVCSWDVSVKPDGDDRIEFKMH